jgi:hypothetical protein
VNAPEFVAIVPELAPNMDLHHKLRQNLRDLITNHHPMPTQTAGVVLSGT